MNNDAREKHCGTCGRILSTTGKKALLHCSGCLLALRPAAPVNRKRMTPEESGQMKIDAPMVFIGLRSDGHE